MSRADDTLVNAATVRWFQELADRGIFTTDSALVIRTWNRWLEAQTGRPATDAVGRHVSEVCPGFERRGLDRYYADALAGEVRILSERFHRYLLPISREFHAAGLTEMAQSARIAPLLDGESVIGTITVIDDVTERVVSERELRSQIAASEQARRVAEEASRLKDEFLATMSHEIRTPLNAVLGWARMLRTQPNLRSRAHALEVIERNATAQLRLIEDLLDMARIISGKLRLQVEPVDVEAVLRAAVEVMQPAADAKKIRIEVNIEARMPRVNGDVDRLQQVIWNLLSNAVKFTNDAGTVRLTAKHAAGTVMFSVADNGVGIPSEFLPHVFDRFRQADASASRRHGGLGIGLALARQIVELHGGSVLAESDGPNRGAIFSVALPATVEAPAESRAAQHEPVTLEGVSILVVDDNQDGRELLTTALEQYGATVRDVASVSEALSAIDDPTFHLDVLVSDVGLPGVDGYELVRQIRAMPGEIRRVPSIAVTAYANPEDRIRALVAGFERHLPKPVDTSVLAAAIAALVSRPGREPHQSAVTTHRNELTSDESRPTIEHGRLKADD